MALIVKSRRRRSSARGRLGDARQRARLVVGLGPGGGQIEAQIGRTDRRGAEALVLARTPAEPLGKGTRHRARVALDGEVEVDRLGAAQQIADGAADEIGGRQAVQSTKQAVHARQAPRALAQGVGHSLTGIPAARIRCLASRTVCCP